MTVTDVTALVTALTALAIAVGGVITAIKVLREVKTTKQLTQTGNQLTHIVHKQLNGARLAADRYQEKLRMALQDAGIPIPLDDSLESHAIPEEEKR